MKRILNKNGPNKKAQRLGFLTFDLIFGLNVIVFGHATVIKATTVNNGSEIVSDGTSLVSDTPIANNTIMPLAASIVSSGTFGSCDWDVDSNGVLTIHAGILGVGVGNWVTAANSITSVVVDPGVIANADSSYLFSDLNKAVTMDVNNLNTSNVKNFSGMFSFKATSNDTSSVLTDISGLDKFDTTNATNMSSMFAYADHLTSLDISSFKTLNVTTFNNMFFRTKALSSLDVSKMDTSEATNTSAMFGASGADIVGLKNFDMAKVTNMSSMFASSTLVNTNDIKDWDVGNVTNMGNLFNVATKLTSVDLTNWNVSNVKDMTSMFGGCSKLIQLDGLESWDVGNVTNMTSMFSNDISLTEITGLKDWNILKVQNMSSIFSSCSSLRNLDLSGWNTENVTDMSSMFSNTKSLNEDGLKGLDKFNTSKVTRMYGMFQGSAFTTLDLSNFDTSSVTDMGSMFASTSSLTNLIGNFDTSKVTNMAGMFGRLGATNLDNLNIADWDTSKVTNFSNMFWQTHFKEILFTKNWDISSATDFSTMFSATSTLTKVELADWDVSNGTNFYRMFVSDSGLKDFDTSKWHVSNKAKDIGEMFLSVPLKKLDLSNWDLTGVTSSNAFLGSNTAIWKLTLGPKAVLKSNMGLIQVRSGMPIENTGYTSISDAWQLVDTANGGTDHNPLGSTLLTTDKLVEQYASPQNETKTYVWQQQPYVSLSLTVPDIDFGRVYSFSGVIKRKDSDFKATVVNNNYPEGNYKTSLTVAMERPMTSSKGDILDNALLFRNNKVDTYLTNQPTDIYNGTFANGTTDINWSENQGLLLDMHGQVIPSGIYQTTLDWELTNSI